MLSTTVTVKLQLFVFPKPSVAVQVTVVVPTLKPTPFSVVPVPVVAPVKAYVTEFSVQLSVAVAFHAVPECVYAHVPIITFSD